MPGTHPSSEAKPSPPPVPLLPAPCLIAAPTSAHPRTCTPILLFLPWPAQTSALPLLQWGTSLRNTSALWNPTFQKGTTTTHSHGVLDHVSPWFLVHYPIPTRSKSAWGAQSAHDGPSDAYSIVGSLARWCLRPGHSRFWTCLPMAARSRRHGDRERAAHAPCRRSSTVLDHMLFLFLCRSGQSRVVISQLC